METGPLIVVTIATPGPINVLCNLPVLGVEEKGPSVLLVLLIT